MKVTGQGIAIGLAVVVALAFLFFGSSVMSVLFPPSSSDNEPFTLSDTSMLTPAESIPTQLPTTLTLTDEVVGVGKEAVSGSRVTVNYIGQLSDGSIFDTSVGKKPFTFTLGGGSVIPGWEQGLLGMKEGGVRQLIIPADMAYGDTGAAGVIPPNATLIFQVELIAVE